MIKVLCASCNTHLFNTDLARLDWPLTGAMFDVVFPGWWIHPRTINLDIFCPACDAFPFYWDGSVPGAVGKNLNIEGADGKPVVISVKQILMGGNRTWVRQVVQSDGTITHEPAPTPSEKMLQAIQPPNAFPCPSCGAKKRFHKKGCPIKPKPVNPGKKVEAVADETPKHLREFEKHRQYRKTNPDPAGILSSIDARARSGPDGKDTPPSQAEITEIERERVSRHVKVDPRLRPGEGYAPKR